VAISMWATVLRTVCKGTCLPEGPSVASSQPAHREDPRLRAPRTGGRPSHGWKSPSMSSRFSFPIWRLVSP